MKNRKKAGQILVLPLLISMLGMEVLFGMGRLDVLAQETETSETIIEETQLYAQSAVLMDADSGRILFEKNGEEFRSMASTTKIMTLLVTLERGNLDDVLSVSEYAASMPDVQLNVTKGEHYYLRDLVYSLMLESHNDSAVAIAEYIGGEDGKDSAERTVEESREAVKKFAGYMNEKAEEIGCTDSWFITPNGLDATEQVEVNGETVEKSHGTTAADLARIMSYCVTKSPQKDRFLAITQTINYQFSNLNQDESGNYEAGGRNFSCSNHNAFLNMMEGAISGKTGFTVKAGYCYVGAVKRDGRTFVVALLACGWPNHKSYKWSDTRLLMQYGIDTYQYFSFGSVTLEDGCLEPLIVNHGQTIRLGEVATAGVQIVAAKDDRGLDGILLGKGEEIQVTYERQEELSAPVHAGDVVGSIEYVLNGEIWKHQLVILTNGIEEINTIWCLRQILTFFL